MYYIVYRHRQIIWLIHSYPLILTTVNQIWSPSLDIPQVSLAVVLVSGLDGVFTQTLTRQTTNSQRIQHFRMLIVDCLRCLAPMLTVHCVVERDDPPQHLLLHSTINSPQCQEFMVSDCLCSDHLLESFDGRIYTYGSVLNIHQRIHEDEHYRENPSNQKNVQFEKIK